MMGGSVDVYEGRNHPLFKDIAKVTLHSFKRKKKSLTVPVSKNTEDVEFCYMKRLNHNGEVNTLEDCEYVCLRVMNKDLARDIVTFLHVNKIRQFDVHYENGIDTITLDSYEYQSARESITGMILCNIYLYRKKNKLEYFENQKRKADIFKERFNFCQSILD